MRAQTPRLVVPIGNENGLCDAEFSPDGSRVVTSGDGNIARLWNAVTGKELLRFEGHKRSVRKASFSPDGLRIITACADGTARVWNAMNGKELLRVGGNAGGLECASFSHDGGRIVTASVKKIVQVWSSSTGRQLLKFGVLGNWLNSVEFSPDGAFIVTASEDTVARVWNASTGKQIRELVGHDGPVTSASFSPDGSYIVTTSVDKTARIWKTSTGKEFLRLKHGWAATWARFSPDGSRIVTSEESETTREWSVTTGKELVKWRNSGYTQSAMYSPDGSRIVTTDGGNEARIWNASSGNELLVLVGYGTEVFKAAFSPDDTKILTVTAEASAKLWDTTKDDSMRFLGRRGNTFSAAYSSDGSRIVLVHVLGGASVLSAATKQVLLDLPDHDKGAFEAQFSTDGSKIVTVSLYGVARVLDASTGVELTKLKGSAAWMRRALFSPNGKQILTIGSDDSTVRIWSAITGAELQKLEVTGGVVEDAKYSPDGKRIAIAATRLGVSIRDARTGRELLRLKQAGEEAYQPVFSPRGDQILTVSGSHVRVWDSTSGQKLLNLDRGNGDIRHAEFSHNGARILTASNDSTTRVWNAKTGKEIVDLITLGKEWAVVTPEGWFDASPGAITEMYWVLPGTLETIDLEQVQRYNWKPGLLSKIWSGDAIGSPPAFPFNRLQPLIDVVPPRTGATVATINLTKRSGGIGNRLQLNVNGTPLELDLDKLNVDRNAKKVVVPVDLRGLLNPTVDNEIVAIAENSDHGLTGRSVSVNSPRQGLGPHDGKLFVLCVGIGKYELESLDLGLPPKDAADFLHAVGLAGKSLFEGRLDMTLLTTAPVSAPKEIPDLSVGVPTKQSIRSAFARISALARPQDTVLVFMAGHGVVAQSGQEGVYCYLTSDATGGNMSVPEIRSMQSVSTEELVQWMVPKAGEVGGIHAQRRVLILDTCAAGEMAKNLADKRSTSSEARKTMSMFAGASGFWVLAGSAADSVSYESSQFGQGILTYSLLLGMKSAKEGQIDVQSLFSFAEDQVPQLVSTLGGVQKPQQFSVGDRTFPIGLLSRADNELIKLASPRRQILRPREFNDRAQDFDSLRLTPLLEKLLSGQNLSPDGFGARTWYVAADDLPGGAVASGGYDIDSNGHITVRLRLVVDGKAVDSATILGEKTKLESLAAAIVAKIDELALKH